VDVRYIVFLLIMIKGIFETLNTFLLPLSILLYHHVTKHGGIAYFAYMVSPHGYHTSGVTSLYI